MNWRDAVWAAVLRHAAARGRDFTRQELIDSELPTIVADAGSMGTTPAQTLSRVLQELRDDGVILFRGDGRYTLVSDVAAEPDLARAVETQVARQTFARVGQSGFRASLDARWGGRCPLTCIAERPLLRASHIVAWSACAQESERLEPENGLLLSALWDAAFDRGLVSFDDDGSVLTFRGLSDATRATLEATGAGPIAGLSAGNRERLALHRAWCTTGEWPTP